MRKNTFIIAAAMILATVFLFPSCLTTTGTTSTGTTATASTTTTSKTIKMYDNCPTDTYALVAELAIKSTNSNYAGVTSFSFSGTPSTSDIQPVATYYGYCTAIKEAIAKGTGKSVTLSFNTLSTGKGTTLDFSSPSAIIKSLLIMGAKNYKNVYAIYKY